jgi:hypothetical protein
LVAKPFQQRCCHPSTTYTQSRVVSSGGASCRGIKNLAARKDAFSRSVVPFPHCALHRTSTPFLYAANEENFGMRNRFQRTGCGRSSSRFASDMAYDCKKLLARCLKIVTCHWLSLAGANIRSGGLDPPHLAQHSRHRLWNMCSLRQML